VPSSSVHELRCLLSEVDGTLTLESDVAEATATTAVNPVCFPGSVHQALTRYPACGEVSWDQSGSWAPAAEFLGKHDSVHTSASVKKHLKFVHHSCLQNHTMGRLQKDDSPLQLWGLLQGVRWRWGHRGSFSLARWMTGRKGTPHPLCT
jgi:hypothetical protein